MSPSGRIFRPGRGSGDRIVGLPDQPAPAPDHGPTSTPPGHGGLPPGHGGIIPGLGVVVAALAGGHVTQPPAGDALQLLTTLTPAGSPLQFDTGANAIPAGLNHLLLVGVCRTDRAANTTDTLRMRFNGDAGAGQYNEGNVTGNTSTASSGTTATTTGAQCAIVAGATQTANAPGSFFMFIPRYADTTFQKIILSSSGTAQSAYQIWSEVAIWSNTAAINRIQVLSANGANCIAGSSISIYLL